MPCVERLLLHRDRKAAATFSARSSFAELWSCAKRTAPQYGSLRRYLPEPLSISPPSDLMATVGHFTQWPGTWLCRCALWRWWRRRCVACRPCEYASYSTSFRSLFDVECFQCFAFYYDFSSRLTGADRERVLRLGVARQRCLVRRAAFAQPLRHRRAVSHSASRAASGAGASSSHQ